MRDEARTVIEVKDLDISFKMATGDVHAIRGVDFTLREGEVLALVGESGCGKSISVKTIMGILPESAVINTGEVIYHGKEESVDLLKKSDSWRQVNINGSKISMVFQDPMTSLNPTMSIGNQLIISIRSHEQVTKREAYARAVELLREVGIT
ncbi:MAG: ABC transporter ATP-binding protein, partial [Lachnospiraceae bacterium]|nr:ABC transporter ATP-binding protein [Lachnospiraceae bacterium]